MSQTGGSSQGSEPMDSSGPGSNKMPGQENSSMTDSSNISMVDLDETVGGIPSRASSERPIIKLSVDLLKTFNVINQKYYAAKKKRQLEESKRDQTKDKKPRHNNGHDDEDYNYIVIQGEKLNNRYTVRSTIGKGSFGRVVRAVDNIENQEVAIKIVKSKQPFYVQAQIELSILESLQKGGDKYNIVKMKDKFVHHKHQCIVFELLSINLFDLLQNTGFQGVSLPLISKFARQLLTTLAYLSSKHGREPGRAVIHCDLKPENILLRNSKKSAIKVIDFGSACFADDKMYTYIQSRFYRAPEILLGLDYSPAIDMWSLGCILVEMHTGKPLFDGGNEGDQVVRQVEILGIPPADMIIKSRKGRKYFQQDDNKKWVLKPKYEQRRQTRSLRSVLGDKFQASTVYNRFEQLIMKMLDYNPKSRIRPSQAKRHPFFFPDLAVEDIPQGKVKSHSSPATASVSPSSDMLISAQPTPQVQPVHNPFAPQAQTGTSTGTSGRTGKTAPMDVTGDTKASAASSKPGHSNSQHPLMQRPKSYPNPTKRQPEHLYNSYHLHNMQSDDDPVYDVEDDVVDAVPDEDEPDEATREREKMPLAPPTSLPQAKGQGSGQPSPAGPRASSESKGADLMMLGDDSLEHKLSSSAGISMAAVQLGGVPEDHKHRTAFAHGGVERTSNIDVSGRVDHAFKAKERFKDKSDMDTTRDDVKLAPGGLDLQLKPAAVQVREVYENDRPSSLRINPMHSPHSSPLHSPHSSHSRGSSAPASPGTSSVRTDMSFVASPSSGTSSISSRKSSTTSAGTPNSVDPSPPETPDGLRAGRNLDHLGSLASDAGDLSLANLKQHTQPKVMLDKARRR